MTMERLLAVTGCQLVHTCQPQAGSVAATLERLTPLVSLILLGRLSLSSVARLAGMVSDGISSLLLRRHKIAWPRCLRQPLSQLLEATSITC